MQVTGRSSEAEREVISWKAAESSEHFGPRGSKPVDFYSWLLHQVCVGPGQSCRRENHLSLEFRREDAARGAASERGDALSRQSGPRAPWPP